MSAVGAVVENTCHHEVLLPWAEPWEDMKW